MINIKNRNFLTLLDFTTNEIEYLLDLSRDLKRNKYAGTEVAKLKGKNIVLLFQKTSTRTRCAFEVAALDQGAHVTYIGSDGSQMGIKESIADTARVLGRMYDAIEFRCFKHTDCLELAKFAGVPVYNGLSDLYHPTQMIADFMTIREKFGTYLKDKKLVFYGDARNNVANSLMIASAKLGMHFVGCCPDELKPKKELIDTCKEIAKETGSVIEFEKDPLIASKNAHVLYTDIWVSMGEPEEVWEQRINLLEKYRVTTELMKLVNKEAIFMHCLPSYHDLNTDIGKKINEKFGLKEMEVENKLFESKKSWAFQQAENRLHSIKAIMVATLS